MVTKKTQAAVVEFSEARESGQFHTPENLAKSIAIEASELLECFQWSQHADPARVREELADPIQAEGSAVCTSI